MAESLSDATCSAVEAQCCSNGPCDSCAICCSTCGPPAARAEVGAGDCVAGIAEESAGDCVTGIAEESAGDYDAGKVCEELSRTYRYTIVRPDGEAYRIYTYSRVVAPRSWH